MTPAARSTIEYIQDTFSVEPYEIWRQKGYKVRRFAACRYTDDDSDEQPYKEEWYIKVMRGYAGDEGSEDGMMRGFFDEMQARYLARKERQREKGKQRAGEQEDDEEEYVMMATVEEREEWKKEYLELKKKGARWVDRAKRDRLPGVDMDMDYEDWKKKKLEESDELCEKWFNARSGVVEEEEVVRQNTARTLFEYVGGMEWA